jgi:serine/threonine protein kinase
MDEPASRYQGRQFGNYRLLSLIGEGGFSEVYLGEHVLLGTEAAIKVMNTRLTDDEFERFRQEALTIIDMAHPNMVRVLDFGLQDRVPYLVMNYAPYGSLRQRYPTGTRLPLPVVVSLVKQTAAVLHYAHEKRVIHRDIKPDNLLIGRDDEILLSDFGIAVAAHNTYSMQTQEAIGTVAYMAPEQLRRKARPASDQYALGVMVYEWLSGELPFEGAPIEVALQHLTEPPPPLREKNPDISPAIEKVVLKALAKDPQQRYSDEMAFAEALESASMAIVPEKTASPFPYDPVFAGREAHYGRRKDPLPRRRVALLASLALVVILSASGVGLFAISHHQVSTVIKVSISTPGTLPTGLPSTTTPDVPLPGSPNWSMYGFDAQHSQFNPYEKAISLKNISDLVPAWVAHINGYIGFTPTIVNDVLYITGGGPTLYAIDTRTGLVIWKTSPQPMQYASYVYSPTVVNGVVYLASDNGALAAFDARTGKLLWSFSSDSATSSSGQDSPTFVNGIIYFGSHSGSVYALDARTGRVIWSTVTGGYTGVAVANGVVYAASNTQLYALNASTGAILWTGPIGTKKTVEVAPVVGSGMVIVTTDDAVVLAFAANGCRQQVCAPRWVANTLQKVWASPAIAYGVIYLSTLYRDFNGGNLVVLDALTGKFLWLAKTDSLYAAPVVANGVVYAINFYGTAYAFNAAGCGSGTCLSLWQNDNFDSNDGIDYSITISDGQVYICTPDGSIHALRAP